MILRPSLCLYIILFAIKHSTAQDIPPEGEAISLTKVPEYINGRPCLKHCIAKGYRDALAPPAALGCSRNSCLCRPDLSPIVYNALNRCMDWSCNNSLDKELASNIFKGYCNAYATPPPSTEKSVAPATVIAETSVETKTTTARVTTTAQVTTTQKGVTVTETLRAGSTTIINYISSSSSSTASAQIITTPSTTTNGFPPTATIMIPTSTTTHVVVEKEAGKSDRSETIALGVGLSFGLSAIVIGIAWLVWSWRGHRGPFKYRHHGDVVVTSLAV